MKGLVVAGLAVILLAVAGGAYLFLQSSSSQGSSTSTGQISGSTTLLTISQTQSTSRTTSSSSSHIQTTSGAARVNVSALTCGAASGKCIITLVNTGGTAVVATGCTLNGQTGVFAPENGEISPGGGLDVSCAPPAGGAIPIPGFHVEGVIQLSDGSSVRYGSSWQ